MFSRYQVSVSIPEDLHDFAFSWHAMSLPSQNAMATIHGNESYGDAMALATPTPSHRHD